MGPRPPDFNEEVVKQAPTFLKWLTLRDGEKMRYACRDFIRGRKDDEERLMRRIMIARRNNLRDHELLKKARTSTDTAGPSPAASKAGGGSRGKKKGRAASGKAAGGGKGKRGRSKKAAAAAAAVESDDDEYAEPSGKRMRPSGLAESDADVRDEMDENAVMTTRSYKSWDELHHGEEFTYNQKYIKGKEGHDWLLKKNIWRRMRYRRENKRMVDQLKGDEPEAVHEAELAATTKVTAKNPTAAALALASHYHTLGGNPDVPPTPPTPPLLEHPHHAQDQGHYHAGG